MFLKPQIFQIQGLLSCNKFRVHRYCPALNRLCLISSHARKLTFVTTNKIRAVNFVKNFSSAETHSEVRKTDQIKKDRIVECNKYLKNLLNEKNYSLVVDYFENILQVITKPNAESYEILIYAYIEMRQTEQVDRRYTEMLTAGFEPSADLMKNVIKYYYKVDNISKALDLLGVMRLRGIPLDTMLLNRSLQATLHIGNLDEAKKILNYAQESNTPFNANTHYLTFIFYLKTDNLAEAEKTIEQMKASNFELEDKFHVALIDYHITHGNLIEAQQMMTSVFYIKKKKLPLNLANRMIAAFLASDRKGEADEILKQIRYTHTSVSTETLEPYLDYYLRHQEINKLLQLVKEMKHYDIQIPSESYKQIILTTARAELYEITKEFWVEMLDRLIRPDTETWNCWLALEVAKGQRLEDVTAWFGYMLQEEVPPDAETANIIVSAYCKYNCPELALALNGVFKKFNLKLTLKHFNMIMNSLGKLNRYEDALKVYDLIIENNCLPDSDTYCNLFHIYSRIRDYEKANAVFQVSSLCPFLCCCFDNTRRCCTFELTSIQTENFFRTS
jgi:pentatricopeptide repeat protein